MGYHILVATEGDVRRWRASWREDTFAPISIGAQLREGDLLRLEAGARITIVCANLELVEQVRPGDGAVPCPQQPPALTFEGRPGFPLRTTPETIPYLIAPRATMMLTTTPHLRWAPVLGNEPYIVEVRGPGVAWSMETIETSLVYPATAPSLQRGQTYTVTVRSGNRSSADEDVPNLDFTVLDANRVQQVEAWEKQISGLPLSPVAANLVRANLYASNGLYAEAIELLESSPDFAAESVPLRLLGDWYATVGVADFAETNFLAAHQRALERGDIAEEALTALALGRLASLRGDKAGTQGWLEIARDAYGWLGDSEGLKQIEAIKPSST